MKSDLRGAFLLMMMAIFLAPIWILILTGLFLPLLIAAVLFWAPIQMVWKWVTT